MSKILDILHAPWAIDAARLEEIQAIYATHLRGDKINIPQVEARLGRSLDNESKPYVIQDGVAIISMEGVIAKRMNLFSQISGGASSQVIARDLQQAVADDAVHSVILDIDSPGGSVDGTQSLMREVRAAAAEKPIVALADGLMASAAYWVGSAADSIYISDDLAQIGSIGVIASHRDISKAEGDAGKKTTLIYAGKYKASGNPYSPLSDADRQTIQSSVDYTYSIFVRDVAENRGVSIETVLSEMADGRLFTGQQAIDAGLVDGVSTLAALVVKLNEDHVGDASSSNLEPFGRQTGEGMSDKKSAIAMTVETLKAEHPEVAKALVAEGFDVGAKAECARIQAVEAQSMPGHDALIASLKFDGTTTGPEAAVQVLGAERKARVDSAANFDADAPRPVAHANAPESVVDDGGGEVLAFDALVQKKVDAGMGRALAIATTVSSHPEAHAAYLKGLEGWS